MSTDQNFLSAAPLAFLLILPVFIYYSLKTIFVKHDTELSSCTVQTRIPEYLIKQYVDRSRSVRKQYTKRSPKHIQLKIKSKQTQACRKTKNPKSLQILSRCSVGLSQYNKINQEIKPKYPTTYQISTIGKKIQNRTKNHQYFCPTKLTTIYEDVAY